MQNRKARIAGLALGLAVAGGVTLAPAASAAPAETPCGDCERHPIGAKEASCYKNAGWGAASGALVGNAAGALVGAAVGCARGAVEG